MVNFSTVNLVNFSTAINNSRKSSLDQSRDSSLLVNVASCDAREVPRVPGDDDEVVVQGCRSNEDVWVADDLALAPELAAYSRESLHDRTAQREDFNEPEKPM